MRSSGKQYHNWKLDDERRQRLTTSSAHKFSTAKKYNHRSGNYSHEGKHTGIDILRYYTDVNSIKRERERRKLSRFMK